MYSVIDNPIRYKIVIPIGNLSPKEARKILNKYLKGNLEEEMRKQLLIDRQNKINKIINNG